MHKMLQIARKILAEQINMPVETVTSEIPFSELGVDSVDVVEVVMTLEDIYDVEFPEDDLGYYPNLEALIATLYAYMQEVKK